nr:tripartite tricarboxylate transporter substrate-binding protein [Desulfobacterales bacterium]
MRSLCTWILVAAMVGLLGTAGPEAQEIKGPIKIVVPYPAGGGSDVVARLIADKLKDALGQAVIVENKPGAGGRIGTEYVKGQ